MDTGGDPGNWKMGERAAVRCGKQMWKKRKGGGGAMDGGIAKCSTEMMGHTAHYNYATIAKRGSTDKGMTVYKTQLGEVKRNRYTNTRAGAVKGWTAWLTTPVNPGQGSTAGPGNIMAQVGDILVRARGGGSEATHGDVVWKIEGSRAWLSGGNVGTKGGGGRQTALATQYLDLDAHGNYKTFLSKQSNNPKFHLTEKFADVYEVILKKNGELIEAGGP
tara:strand:- start:471 stop:1127 length:657 start_codon:yes stop_codon:yes gene_type:complete